MIPVLHLESHGCKLGLKGPDSTGHSSELLTWNELTIPLQKLNLATRCNLVVFVAACIGFAGILALYQGPRAPAVALVGPDGPLPPSSLLWGSKEFYRRWQDTYPRLSAVAENASRETQPITFKWEPFAILAYDALIEWLIVPTRPAEHLRHKERVRQRILAENRFPSSETESRLAEVPPLPLWVELQQVWDQLFMIDLYPENRERFAVDMRLIVESVLKVHGQRDQILDVPFLK